MDGIAVGQRGREPLQHDDAGALAADVAVRPRASKVLQRPSGDRKRPLLIEDRVFRPEHHVHAAGHGQGALAVAAGSGRRDGAATSEDEQAVSKATLGPRKPKK